MMRWPRVGSIVLRGTFLIALLVNLNGSVLSQPSPEAELGAMDEEALGLLTEYLKFDTSNPPGNEVEAARFIGQVLEGEGIEFRLLEAAPNRVNLYARLEGTGKAKPLVLLQHLDAVPVDYERWSEEPFGGVIKDGFIWGRGVLDMKGLGVIHLMTFLSLKRGDKPLDRDVILLAVADEEQGGGFGMGWVMDNFPELFEDVGLVIAEGGKNIATEEALRYVGLEVAQKSPLWLRLSIRGVPGHASVPPFETVAGRLVRGVRRMLDLENPYELVPVVEKYFSEMAPFQKGDRQRIFSSIKTAIEEPDIESRLGPAEIALLRNTIALTVLHSGIATNVLPSEAYAELDCRLLPGESPEDFLTRLAEAINDPAIQIEPLLSYTTDSSPLEGEIFAAVASARDRVGLDFEVGISVLPGFTDSRIFRNRGIPAYGFTPFKLAHPDSGGAHSRDERLGLDDFRSGLQFFYRVVEELVTPDSEID